MASAVQEENGDLTPSKGGGGVSFRERDIVEARSGKFAWLAEAEPFMRRAVVGKQGKGEVCERTGNKRKGTAAVERGATDHRGEKKRAKKESGRTLMVLYRAADQPIVFLFCILVLVRNNLIF